MGGWPCASTAYSANRLASSSLRIIKPCFSLSHQPFISLANILTCFWTSLRNSDWNSTSCMSNTLPRLVMYCAGVMVYGASVGAIASSVEASCSNLRCSVKRSLISEIIRASSKMSLRLCAASCSLCNSSIRDLTSESLLPCVPELCPSIVFTDLYSEKALVLRWLLSIHFSNSSKLTPVSIVLCFFAQFLS